MNRVADIILHLYSSVKAPYSTILDDINEQRPESDRDHEDVRLILSGPPNTPVSFPVTTVSFWDKRIERNPYNLLETLMRARYAKNRQGPV